nr:MAG TPA: hypothetical protein [Bacteriophage sp.]
MFVFWYKAVLYLYLFKLYLLVDFLVDFFHY